MTQRTPTILGFTAAVGVAAACGTAVTGASEQGTLCHVTQPDSTCNFLGQSGPDVPCALLGSSDGGVTASNGPCPSSGLVGCCSGTLAEWKATSGYGGTCYYGGSVAAPTAQAACGSIGAWTTSAPAGPTGATAYLGNLIPDSGFATGPVGVGVTSCYSAAGSGTRLACSFTTIDQANIPCTVGTAGKCPSAGLVGCCSAPGVTDGYESTGYLCDYNPATAQAAMNACQGTRGAWTTTIP